MLKSERWFSWGWLFVVLAVLAAGGYIWWSKQDHRERAALGRIVRAEPFEGGQETAVMTPAGKVTVRIGDRVSELPDGQDGLPNQLRAPRKGSFVGISIDSEDGARTVLRTNTATEIKLPEFTLVVGGHRYSLDDLRPDRMNSDSTMIGTKSGYLAIAGTTGNAQLEVVHDGERGLFGIWGGATDPGRFANLDAQEFPVAEASCGEPRVSVAFARRDLRQACSVGAVRTQYVAGLGWSAAGTDWLAVSVRLRVPVIHGDDSNHWDTYEPTGQPAIAYSFGQDKKPAVSTFGTGSAPILFASVTEHSTTTFGIGLRYDAKRDEFSTRISGPKAIKLASTWTIPI
ncbi:hypothetical protein [Kribbella sindirgiensis]|uniref:Uncharacterized protein n=1 Tax=Kribbella sindirgiensis TaxID=1124744 RepID=A0A4V2M2C1_9ACTN|nr:hypothetical protein [Kribbella sindirgiensis]TCC24386.1 hypothetical protein E0H50_32615 [Kribbella sindirgiensis]